MSNSYEEDVKLVVQECINKKVYKTPADKLHFKIKQYSEFIGNEDSYITKYPVYLCWKINSNCNLRCKHCYFSEAGYASHDDLPTGKIFEIIDQLADMNIVHVRLSGGEVFLRKDILEIIKRLKQYNIQVGATTNATLISPKLADNLAEILNPNSDYINVSLEGTNAETHDFIRGEGVFDKTISGINLLTSRNINVFINSTVTKHNVSKMYEMYEFAQKLKAKKLSVSKIIPMAKEHEDLVPKLEDLIFYYANLLRKQTGTEKTFLEQTLFQLYDFVDQKDASSLIYSQIKDKPYYKNFDYKKVPPCHSGERVYFDADGTVYLCNVAGDFHLFPMGNLKLDSFKDIWNNGFKNELFINRDLSKSTCKNCRLSPVCRATCPVMSYLKYETINAPDGNCKLAAKCFK